MKAHTDSHRLAILSNIAPPYRIPIYRYLATRFVTVLVLSGREDNRQWESLPSSKELPVKTAWGITIRRRIKAMGRQRFDTKYLHLNPGYLVELIRFSPEAVISIEMGTRSLIALLYCFVFRRKLWVWWGGTPHTERTIGPLKLWVRKQVFTRFTPRWISYGETSTNYLLQLGVHRDRILQIQNNVDDSVFSPYGEPYPMDAACPRMLVVGQLVGRKGLDSLLDAIDSIAPNVRHFSLILVGDGPERDRLLTRCAGIRNVTVIHIPYVSPEEMPKLYRSCDFMVFPTLEDVWGLVVNEAILCGLPVLSSIYAGCTAEIVPEQYWVDPLDPGQFSRSLSLAIMNGISPIDPAVLKTQQWISRTLASDIERVLGLS